MVVGTWHACSRRKRPAYDERGRAVGGEQSEFGLSLSLAGSGKAFHVGMSTKDVDDEELVALWWWCPHASGRSPREILAARRTRLDLREVDADEVFPPVGEDILEEDAGAAAAGAASGAPEGPPLRKIVQARGFDTDASLSGSNSCVGIGSGGEGRVRELWVRRGGGGLARRCRWRVAIRPGRQVGR